MRSTFGGLEIAKSGIFMSQQALNLTGHNISNAETTGYSRQRIDLASIDPYTRMGKFAPMSTTLYGQGVRSLQVSQIRDSFVDRQFRTAYNETSYWSTRFEAVDQVQSLFDESTEYSISNTISEFFGEVDKLFQYPADTSVRTSVREKAKLMTEVIRDRYKSFVDQQTDQNEALKVNVDQVNNIAKQVAELNKQIYGFELTGQPANDLRDKRNLLLDELSGLADITYTDNIDGKMSVFIGGKALVNHSDYTELEAVADVTNPIAGEGDLYSVRWKDDNSLANISSGEMKAHMDMRDGNTTDNIGIPYYVNKLNKLANAIATEINKLHKDGYTHPYTDEGGVSHGSSTGILFFDESSPVTAKNFNLSQDILDSEFNIATSSVEMTLDPTTNEYRGNQLTILDISKLITDTSLSESAATGVSGFQSFYRSLVVEIGVDAQTAERQLDNYMAVASAHENTRFSISGVSLDEEMTNLIKFQHSYSAASRALTTLDDALEVLINRTGRVGL